MNTICETCDARLRLHKCDGKDGDFKYCYRPPKLFDNTYVIPFNEISDLMNKLNEPFIDNNTIYFEPYPYPHSKHNNLLVGKNIETQQDTALGFITS